MDTSSTEFTVNAFFTWQTNSETIQHKWLHPCRVNSAPHLIHHTELETQNPEYYALLCAYAAHYKWTLSPDRRQSLKAEPHHASMRRKWLPTFLLAVSMSSPCVAQDVAIQNNNHDTANRFDATIKAMSSAGELDFSPAPPLTLSPATEKKSSKGFASSNAYWQQRIKHILNLHWIPSPSDPENTAEDLAKMATYFSQFPDVRRLFKSIEFGKWQLKYAAKTYETKIHGSRMSVDSATVLFDSRSAAQFKFYRTCTEKTPFCVASPADVLLHELLHVEAVINHPETFIAQGGMNNYMYPYEHERETILKEKSLYQSMTVVDGQPRPLRNEHSGRHVLAACVTCLK